MRFMLRSCCLLLVPCFLYAQPLPQLIDRFFDDYYFKFYPSTATQTGVHKYDSQLEDYSRAAVDARVKSLHAYEQKFNALPPTADRDILIAKRRTCD